MNDKQLIYTVRLCLFLHWPLCLPLFEHVCQSFHVSVSSYSVFCNALFANFCTYLGNQFRWAFAFLLACHCDLYCFLLFILCWLNGLIDWLIGNLDVARCHCAILLVLMLKNCCLNPHGCELWDLSHTGIERICKSWRSEWGCGVCRMIAERLFWQILSDTIINVY